MLQIKNLHVEVEDKKILNGINLHIKEGEMHGHGTMTTPNGVKQEGMWHEGKFVEVDESKKN